MIAEDNLEISDTMRNYLIRAGYVVSQAFDGGGRNRASAQALARSYFYWT
ncbi:MAG: hypothetical protein L6V85_05360 [Clostridiales bacterium]|nr:MAG: hypothetical protein L6V85_05360 [Clostridiales bacterium]